MPTHPEINGRIFKWLATMLTTAILSLLAGYAFGNERTHDKLEIRTGTIEMRVTELEKASVAAGENLRLIRDDLKWLVERERTRQER